MNEEIEYAEMLEIPVSTVNVLHKNSAKPSKKRAAKTLKSLVNAAASKLGVKEKKNQPPAELEYTSGGIGVLPQAEAEKSATENTLKESVIAQVNDQLQISEETSEPSVMMEEGMQSQGMLDFGEIPERIDTVRLYSEEERENFFQQDVPEQGEEQPLEESQPKERLTKQERLMRRVLNVEAAAACALCGAIFLTNVFVPGSAINTFFRSLDGSNTPKPDARVYSDFQLRSIVSSFSDAELSLSPEGVLSFTEECCIYPAADGKVVSVLRETDGTYTVKVAYSDAFSGVFNGVDHVYYEEGDKVKSNVPIAYSYGETEVQVTMYAQGNMLNCFELTDENCLAWIEQE